MPMVASFFFYCTEIITKGEIESDVAIRNNNCSYNQFGILFEYSTNNRIEHNTVNSNSLDGIQLRSHSNNNVLTNNNANSNSGAGICCFRYSNKNIIANITAKNNGNKGRCLNFSSCNNNIYLNNFVDKLSINDTLGELLYLML